LARNLFNAVEDKVYLAAFSFLDSQSTPQVVIVRRLEPREKQAIGLLNHCRPPGACQPLYPDMGRIKKVEERSRWYSPFRQRGDAMPEGAR
jgi:hypothetical protein